MTEGDRTRFRGETELHGAANYRNRCRTLTSSKWFLAAGLSTLLFSASGCASACTAVGWSDELEVKITGSRSAAVERLEICFDGSCYAGDANRSEEESPQLDLVAVAKTEAGWTVTTSMQTPGTVQLRAYSEGGEILADQEAELSWKRVGGSARCGGPHEAKTKLSLGL